VCNNPDLVKSLIKALCFSNPKRVCSDVLNASSHETYVETVCNGADTIHLGLNEWMTKPIEQVYSRLSVNIIRRLHLGLCDVIIDITKEDFYGKVEGLWIHEWTKEKGVTGHFQFLVCSVKYRNNKFPIAVIMLRVGAIIADAIGEVLSSCKKAGLKMREVLLDRGFYSADNIRELKEQNVFYLIFAPKNILIKNMLEGAKRSVIVEHKMTLNKDKTKTKIDTNLALVKNVQGYDWAFATNLELSGAKIVQKYRVRWNIETDFRVMDEARIKSKSKRPEVRLFYFLITCLLFFVWNTTQKFKQTFKKFIILTNEECKKQLICKVN
jgi:hypothetical protein